MSLSERLRRTVVEGRDDRDVESSLRVARLASAVCWPGCVLQAQCPVTRNPRRTQSRCIPVRMHLKRRMHCQISCVSCNVSRISTEKTRQT